MWRHLVVDRVSRVACVFVPLTHALVPPTNNMAERKTGRKLQIIASPLLIPYRIAGAPESQLDRDAPAREAIKAPPGVDDRWGVGRVPDHRIAQLPPDRDHMVSGI